LVRPRPTGRLRHLARGVGCDFECVIEPDTGCTGEPSECFDVVCGDGEIVLTKGCEDSNTEAGDGCSDRCQIELPTSGITLDFRGSLDDSDLTWTRPSARCEDGFGDRLFDAYWFVNPFDISVTIDIDVTFSADGYLHLLKGTFSPEDPTATCLFGNDDSSALMSSALRAMTVPAGATRVIAVSSFSPPAIGAYTGTISVR
jgi:cysteine-rich repeat protein